MNAPPISIDLPATSANLGPGLDSIALAMDLRIRIAARPAADFQIEAEGRDRRVCASTDNNLVLSTYRSILAAEGKEIVPLHLTVRNEIPIGKGCGSSAAARLAGITLANHFAGLGWSRERILYVAAEVEGHADNAAACLLGGVVIVRPCSGSNKIIAKNVKVKSPRRWPILLALPPEPLSTGESRKVLPDLYSRADAVSNMQSAMLLVSAFREGDTTLCVAAMTDRMHEPFREALCPLLHVLKPLAGREGVLGVALSGAGPSVLLLLHPDFPPSAARSKVAAHLQAADLPAELLLTRVGGGCRIQVRSRA